MYSRGMQKKKGGSLPSHRPNKRPAWQRRILFIAAALFLGIEFLSVLDAVLYGFALRFSPYFPLTAPALVAILVAYAFPNQSYVRQGVILIGTFFLAFLAIERIYYQDIESLFGIAIVAGFGVWLWKYVPKQDWFLWIQTAFVSLAALIFIHVPIAVVLALSGVCTTGNAFAYLCSNPLADISFAIATMLQILMIFFFAPIIVWGVALIVALRNWRRLTQSTVPHYQQKLLLVINISSAIVLLLPLPIFLMVVTGSLARVLYLLLP